MVIIGLGQGMVLPSLIGAAAGTCRRKRSLRRGLDLGHGRSNSAWPAGSAPHRGGVDFRPWAGLRLELPLGHGTGHGCSTPW